MSAPFRILVVEDEFLTLNAICESLEETGYKIAGTAKSASEALVILDEQQTDLVVLDISIQGPQNGIWLGEQISKTYKLPFIYLTAFSDQKTIEAAFETVPSSYLIKPFNPVDIYTAIELALRNFERAKGPTTLEQAGLTLNDSIFIKEQHLYSKIRVGEIHYVKAESKHVQVKASAKTYQPRYSFTEFSEILPSDQFIQVHRSYLVNKSSVDHLGPNFLIVQGDEIPISNQRKESVYQAFRMV